MDNKIQIIVLAAGHGKRMQNDELPKVLVPLHGRPMISYLLEAVKRSNVCGKPIIVIGQSAEQVKQALGDAYMYVMQSEQLGTGHAVACTRSMVEGTADQVMVLYGDHPLVSAAMIKKLAAKHQAAGTVLTMATVHIENFDEWRAAFIDFARIIRDDSDSIAAVVEKRDATPAQLEIKEVNPGYYCFSCDWLWQNLERLENNNTQKEYYLTDLVAMARSQQLPIASVEISSQEALGVNTAAQLALVSQLIDPSDVRR